MAVARRVGLAVESKRARAVTMRRDRIDWRDEEWRTPNESIADCVSRLLDRRPGARLIRVSIVAAVSPAYVQTRRISPSSLAAQQVREALRANPDRFFLHGNRAPLLSPLYDDGDFLWAAAYERAELEGIAEGCRRSRGTLKAVVPAIMAVAHDLRDGERTCADAGVIATVTMARGKLKSVRRAHGGTAGGETEPGADVTEARFADAVGAARYDSTVPFFLHHDQPIPLRQRQRTILAAGAALSALSAVAAPDCALARAEARASARLEQLRPAVVETAPRLAQLRAINQELEGIVRFGRSRPAIRRVLAELAQALPDSTIISSLHIDSVAGTMVLLSTHGTVVLESLVAAGLRDPQVVGAVTREQSAIGEAQRITVRFRMPAEQPWLSTASSHRSDPR